MKGRTNTDALDALLSSVTSSFLVVSPFISMGAMTTLLGRIPSTARLVVFTNWSPRAVQAGVTDPRIFSPVRSRGGRIMLHARLHGKLFARLPQDSDPGQALIGSANLTGPGTGWSGIPNLELLVPSSLDEPHVRTFLRTLRDESVEAEAADADLALAAACHVHSTPRGEDLVSPRKMPPPLTLGPREFLVRLRLGTLPFPLEELSESWQLAPDLHEVEMFNRIGAGLIDGPYYLLARAVVRATVRDVEANQYEIYRVRAESVGMEVVDAEAEWRTLMEWVADFFPQRFQTMQAGPLYLAEKFAEVSATY